MIKGDFMRLSLIVSMVTLMLIMLACGGSAEQSSQDSGFSEREQPSSTLSEGEPAFKAGEKAYRQGLWTDAISHFDEAIQIDPDHAKAYLYRGITYHQQNRWNPDDIIVNLEHAIHGYTKAIELDPDDTLDWGVRSSSYNLRGLAYAELEQYETAINDYDKAIQLRPLDSNLGWNRSWAYINRGISYHALEQYETAINDYDKVIQRYPDHPWAYVNRGISYHELGQYETAINDYDKVIQLGREDTINHKPFLAKITNPKAEAYNHRGLAHISIAQRDYSLLESGQIGEAQSLIYEQAKADFFTAIAADPNVAEYWSNRGDYYSITGGSNGDDYTKAIQLTKRNNPENVSALALYYNKRGTIEDKAEACSLDSQYC